MQAFHFETTQTPPQLHDFDVQTMYVRIMRKTTHVRWSGYTSISHNALYLSDSITFNNDISAARIGRVLCGVSTIKHVINLLTEFKTVHL